MQDLEWTPRRPALPQNGAERREGIPPHAGAVKLDGKGRAFARLEAFFEIKKGILFHSGQFPRVRLADGFGHQPGRHG
jgi:hypothetical protein